MVNAVLELPALPLCKLVLDPPLSDEEFERLSEGTEFVIVERASDGTIVVGELSGWMTSSAGAEINGQFANWAKQRGLGHSLMRPGVFLSDGSCFCPCLAFVSNGLWKGITRESRDRFLRLAPDFVVELDSQRERLAAKQRKMESWMANGVQLAWFVDPYEKQVHVYEPGAAPRIETGSNVAGCGPVEGFVLDLEEIWRCYE